MKRLNLILNGKGGVGKSFFAVNFVQYLKDKNLTHAALDSDNENSTLKRFHPDASFIDLADRRGLDEVFNVLEKSSLVVMDCRAASTDLFLDFFETIDVAAVLSGMGAALTLIMPVNHETDSVDQVQRMADGLGSKCNYVIVRNAAHSDRFEMYEGSEVRELITKQLGGLEITMSQLPDWLVIALQQQNVTITKAVTHPAFSLLDRQRLQTWQRKLYAGIEAASGLLLPTHEK